MKFLLNFRIYITFFVLISSGCMIPDSNHVEPNFHLLFHTESEGNQSSTNSLSFHLREVSIPPYLDDSRMTYKIDKSTLIYRDNDRWAEPIGEGIARVIALNLSNIWENLNFSAYPHRPKPNCLYEISITVLSFEKIGGDQVLADFIVDVYNQNKILKQFRKRIFHPIEKDGASNEVSSLSLVLGLMCDFISAEIDEMPMSILYRHKIKEVNFFDKSIHEVVQLMNENFLPDDHEFKFVVKNFPKASIAKFSLMMNDVSVFEASNRIAKKANLDFGIFGKELVFSGN